MEKREKILVGVLGVVAVAAAAWFGLGMLKSDKGAPAAPPPPTPIAAAPAHAGGAQAPDALIEQALEITGTLKSLDRISEQLASRDSFAAYEDKVGPEVREAISKALLESFPPETFRQAMRAAFKTDYNEAYLRAMVADASQPAIQKLIALEASSQPKPEELAAFVGKLQQTPLPPGRLQLLGRLDDAAGISRQTVDIALLTAKSMMQGLSTESGHSMAEATDKIEAMRAQLGEKMRQAILFTLAYLYRDVGDTDLAAYAKLYESPHGAWFIGKVYQALRGEIQAGSERFGARLPELARQFKHAPASATVPAQPPAMAEAGAEADTAGEAHAAPVPQSHVRPHRHWRQDARKCLELGDNKKIMRCAEAYY